MSTLVVAPDSSLSLAKAEVESVVNQLGAKLLHGEVTPGRLWDNLRELGGIDVLWFACHGTRDGVILSDGSILDVGAAASLARTFAPKLVVLNTCDSVRVGNVIHEASGAAVVMTIAPVEDVTAFFTGVQFAYHLANGRSVRAAYEFARPGNNDNYILLMNNIGHTGDRVDEILRELQSIRQEILDLARDLSDVKRQVNENTRKLDNVAHRPTKRRSQIWTIGYILFVCMFLFSIFEFRQMIGMTFAGVMALFTLLASVAFVFLAIGFDLEPWRFTDEGS